MSDTGKLVKKKLKFLKEDSYKLSTVTGASLTGMGNSRFVLNFFRDSPVIAEYADFEIEPKSGKVIKETMVMDNDYLDIERIITSGIELDLNTLKSISTLILNQINMVENSKI